MYHSNNIGKKKTVIIPVKQNPCPQEKVFQTGSTSPDQLLMTLLEHIMVGNWQSEFAYDDGRGTDDDALNTTTHYSETP